MARVQMVPPGQTGYIGPNDLYSFTPGRVPLIMRSVCTTSEEAGPNALEVYHNPSTHKFEVRVRPGVKATHHPGAAISGEGFFIVVMVLPNGTKIEDEIPEGYWRRW